MRHQKKKLVKTLRREICQLGKLSGNREMALIAIRHLYTLESAGDSILNLIEIMNSPLPVYCVMNEGDCPKCSLINYGKDCRNNPINTLPGQGGQAYPKSRVDTL